MKASRADLDPITFVEWLNLEIGEHDLFSGRFTGLAVELTIKLFADKFSGAVFAESGISS